jgi:alpha-L-rhamnosidase
VKLPHKRVLKIRMFRPLLKINQLLMKRNCLLLVLLVSLICLSKLDGQESKTQIISLTCEYLENPLGIDVIQPRLSWKINSTEINVSQSAYRILVASSLDLLDRNEGDLWDTGERKSNQSIHVKYAGAPLVSRQRCYWKVMVWDAIGLASDWSEVASWEMALLDKSEWEAYWIEAPSIYDWIDFKSKVREIERSSPKITYEAAPYLRKDFTIKKQHVKARVYISGMGLYELSINGEKVGDHVLDPAFTDFDKRVHYLTYDVTSQLEQGRNTLGVLLGNGWYNMDSRAVWGFNKAPWKDKPTCLLQLEIEYADGTIEKVLSNESWKAAPSPIIYNDIRQGEKYDATLEIPNWNMPLFDDGSWANARVKLGPMGQMKAQMIPANKIMREVKPISVQSPVPGVYVVDMGQNIAGWIELKVKGSAGEIVKMKFGEMLKDDGTLDQYNIARHHRETEFQVAEYTLKGSGQEVWEPKFTYYGFQYVQIEGYPGRLSQDDITGKVIHTSFGQSGSFSCSNDIINKIHHASEWSFISNFLGYPTDCPQREKNGWTGDAHLSAETALLTFKPQMAYTKWLFDCQDAQLESGLLPGIVPTSGWGYTQGGKKQGYGPAWDGAYIWISWYMYLYSGDEQVLHTHYANMKKSIGFMMENSEDHILDIGLGDWVFINTYAPRALTSTACYFDLTSKVAQIATILDKEEDAEFYGELAEKIRSAFNQRFYNEKEKSYGGSEQTSLAAALYFHMVPPKDVKNVAGNLAKVILNSDSLLDCGVLGAKWIPHALSDNGFEDIAFQISKNTRYPGWGYWMEQGATTLWEDFNMESLDNSRNHMFFGDIVHWCYKALAGIQPDQNSVGFKHFFIRPFFPESLEFVKASHDCMFGQIKSEWKRVEGGIEMLIEVPANTSSTINLPKGDLQINNTSVNKADCVWNYTTGKISQQFELGSGVYHMVLNY